MPSLIVLGIILALILVVFISGKLEEKRTLEKKKNYLKALYGRAAKNTHSILIDFIDIKKEFKDCSYQIDDITFQDLDMELLFQSMNYCQSVAGKSCLLSILRNPLLSDSLLEERQKHIAYFSNHESDRIDFLMFMSENAQIDSKKIKLFFKKLDKSQKPSFILDLVSDVCIVISFALGLLVHAYFFFLFVGLLLFSISNYLTRKQKITEDLSIFSYFNHLLNRCEKMQLLSNELRNEFDHEFTQVENILKEMKQKRIGANLYFSNSGKSTGEDFLKVIFIYINMMFHFDLIYYCIYLKYILQYEKDLISLMDILGEIEAYVSISYYMAYKEKNYGITIPSLKNEDGAVYEATGLYHPLVEKPVKNDIHQTQGILLTGSNASGKSTFLKTVALNCILAQTVGFVCADSYNSSLFRTFSSMALRDSIKSGESYFVVEVKAMKRLFDELDQVENMDIPLLITIDEILRGTNTRERIAASTELLLALSKKHALCFAATHDFELTETLKDHYDNYHFEEIVEENNVRFPYIIKIGPATSRNAIKLLEIMGFDKEIVEKSNERATYL